MKVYLGFIAALLFSSACLSNTPADINKWGDMTGKVGRVNVKDFPFTIENGVGTLVYKGVSDKHSFGAPGLQFDAQPFRGKNLSFTAQLKTNGSAGGSSIWMRIDGKDGTLEFDNGSNRSLKNSTDWVDFEVILPVSQDAEKVLIGLLHHSSGEVKIRNTKVEITNKKPTSMYNIKDEYSMDLAKWTMAKGSKEFYEATVNDGVATIKATTKNKGKAYASWSENFTPKQFIGQRVRFSADIKTLNVKDGYAGLWMRVDGSGDARQFDNMKDRKIEETTDWKRYEVVLDIKNDSVKNLAFGLLLVGSGQAWIRNPKLESVGIDVETTN
jgi:hypothetical protein